MKKSGRKKRNQLEIYFDVLRTIKLGWNKPTRIMYGANLSWKPLQKILDSMISQGYIRECLLEDNKDRRTNRCYELTQRGENVINYLSRAKELIEFKSIMSIQAA